MQTGLSRPSTSRKPAGSGPWSGSGRTWLFARLYHLDSPCPGKVGRGSEIMKLSLELNVSPSTLYKWRETILADLLLAAVQAGVLRPF